MGVFDFIVVPVVMFVLALVGVTTGLAFHYTNPAIANTITNTTGLHNYYYIEGIFSNMDYVLVFIFIGMEMAVVLRAFYLYSEPRELAIMWVVAFMIVFLSFLLSNIFTFVFRSPALQYGTSYFTNTLFIIYDFPLINTLMLGIYTVAMFSKLRRGQS